MAKIPARVPGTKSAAAGALAPSTVTARAARQAGRLAAAATYVAIPQPASTLSSIRVAVWATAFRASVAAVISTAITSTFAPTLAPGSSTVATSAVSTRSVVTAVAATLTTVASPVTTATSPFTTSPHWPWRPLAADCSVRPWLRRIGGGWG